MYIDNLNTLSVIFGREVIPFHFKMMFPNSTMLLLFHVYFSYYPLYTQKTICRSSIVDNLHKVAIAPLFLLLHFATYSKKFFTSYTINHKGEISSIWNKKALLILGMLKQTLLCWQVNVLPVNHTYHKGNSINDLFSCI